MNQYLEKNPIALGSKKLCIFGTGGFGRETLLVFIDMLAGSGKRFQEHALFMVSDDDYQQTDVMGVPVIKKSEFDSAQHQMIIAVGEPSVRKKIVEQFPADTQYATVVHPTAVISDWVVLGEGSIVTAGTIITCNIGIGKHAQLNLHTTVGHDCTIGDYFTTAPGAKISGICNFGDCVYFGTSASVRQGVKIVDNVTIGMGGVVVKDVLDSGVYVGNPLKPLAKK